MFEFQFFPVYGFVVGVNYWDSTMDYTRSMKKTHNTWFNFLFLYLDFQ